MVDLVVEIVCYFGIFDLVIGLIIIVFGISLFELVVSIVGVLKGEDDLVLGNIIGLNIFNLLVVLGMLGLIFFGLFDFDVFNWDMWVMFGLILLLFLFSFDFIGKWIIFCMNGVLFFVSFIGY